MRHFLTQHATFGPLFLQRIKLLPTLVVFAGLLMVVKFDRVYQTSKLLFVSSAQAQDPVKDKPADATQKPAAEPVHAAEEAPKDMPKDAPSAQPAAHDVKAVTAEGKEDFNILDLTPSKIEVLRTLSKRHQELVARENSIAEREATLEAVEKRLDQKVASLDKIQQYLETLLKQKEEKEKESTKRLVMVYEKMKPAVAANILQGIDLETLLNIMEQMKEGKASEIISKMEPLRARILTMELAQRRQKQEQAFQTDFAHQVANEASQVAEQPGEEKEAENKTEAKTAENKGDANAAEQQAEAEHPKAEPKKSAA